MCSVTKGDFPITITWKLNGEVINPIDGIIIAQMSKRISSLSVENAQDYHRGNYTCTAKNKAGEASHTASLKINGDFKIDDDLLLLFLFYSCPNLFKSFVIFISS